MKLALAVLLLAADGAAAPDRSAAIIEQTHTFIRAFDAADVPALEKLLAPGFVRADSARLWPREVYLRSVESRARSKIAFKDRRFSDEQVRFFGATAIYTGETSATMAGPAGKPIKVERIVTLVWVDIGGAWTLAHQQSMDSGVEAEREMWNRVYREAVGFNAKPNRLLVEAVQGVPPGRALDVGMGQGRNALYLAGKGWQVTGVDIADEGIRQAKQAADREGLKLDAVVQDIDDFDWGVDKWNLICFIYAGGRQEVPKVRASLKKGGLVVIEFFHQDAVKGSNMDSAFKTNELPALYKDGFKVLRYEEVEDVADFGMQKMKLVRFVAQKL